jgi:hypothetical protein
MCDALGSHGVNLRGLSVSDTVDHAVVRLVVDDPLKAIHILGEHGALVVETDVLAVKLEHKPGALAKLASRLARAKINIEYAYGTADGGLATIYLRVSDPVRAEQLLAPKKRQAK